MSKITKEKILIIFITIALCLSFFGCSKENEQTVVDISTTNTTTEISEKSSEEISTTTKVDEEVTTNKESTTWEVVSDPKKETTTKTAETKATTKIAKPVETKKTETTKVQQTTVQATKVTTTQAPTQAQKYIKCTISIECKKILDNKSKLKADHEQYLNGNGVILSNTEITVKEGDSVYDALKKACDDNAIPLNARQTNYGCYIVGINNIDEKDCGSSSGWMYMVNGEYPGKSVNKYILSNGDNIVFSYTC